MTTKKIRKELAILINEMMKNCSTASEINKAINDSRRIINNKYGNKWRSLDDSISNYNYFYKKIKQNDQSKKSI